MALICFPPASSSELHSEPSSSSHYCHLNLVLLSPADPTPLRCFSIGSFTKEQSAMNTSRIKTIANIFRTHFNQKSSAALTLRSIALCRKNHCLTQAWAAPSTICSVPQGVFPLSQPAQLQPPLLAVESSSSALPATQTLRTQQFHVDVLKYLSSVLLLIPSEV